MRALPPTIEMASFGQASTQVSQPVHFASSTLYILGSSGSGLTVFWEEGDCGAAFSG